jgi:membrane-anchored mycosin MYCP
VTPPSARTRHRVAAAAVTALLLGFGPALPALADPGPGSGSTADPGSGAAAPPSWQPPPVDPGAAPPPGSSTGAPDHPYAQSGNSGCITTGVGATTLTGIPPAQQMLNLKQAQEFSTGKGVTVAVIDSGVNPHPFLKTGGRLTSGGDYIQADGNALQDCDGHGTIVAGIVGADTRGTDLGFSGVAPDADILAIRQTDGDHFADNAQPPNTAGDLDTLAEAIAYAASVPSVKVITMSVDDCVPMNLAQSVLRSPSAVKLQAAIDKAVNQQDKVVVAAAGNTPNAQTADQSANGGSQQQAQASPYQCTQPQNDNSDPNNLTQVEIPPVYAHDVLSVASVDPLTGSVSNFSEWGPWVSVAAPGERIISVDPGQGGTGLSDSTTVNGKTQTLQGTSFAAPYVAGVAALIRAKFPDLTARQVMERIESTAQHPSGPGGHNDQVGFGIIDPVAALTAVIPGQNGVPMDGNTKIAAAVPQADARNWTPMRVALIGIGAALVLLLITGFTARTLRHNRERRTSA